jgi:recombination protein RecT
MTDGDKFALEEARAMVATVANKPPIVVLRERLEQRKGELKAALVDITPEQFIRAVITSATINPEIQACSWQSVWLACMRACRDGLLPDGVDGAIVPFKSNAQWLPMYQGLLRRFRRSGQFKWVTANVVRQGEEFEHWIDEAGEHFKHVPGDDITVPIEKVYAMATTKDGGLFVAVLPIAEANKIRNMSRTTREDSPWKQWPEEMYKKTALRRLSKLLPSARDIIGDEDEQIEPPASTPPTFEPRRAGAAAALEQFAASPSVVGGSTPSSVRPEEGDGGEQVPDSETEGPPHGSPADSAPAAADPAVADAYERGKADKAKGHSRKAVPPDFRDADKTALAAAWIAGHDAQPMPGKRE